MAQAFPMSAGGRCTFRGDCGAFSGRHAAPAPQRCALQVRARRRCGRCPRGRALPLDAPGTARGGLIFVRSPTARALRAQ